MERRQFLAASLATSAFALAHDAAAQAPAAPAREFYQMRRYSLKSGPQLKLTESYFGDALIPALARLGLGPVGAFKLDIGPETPAYYMPRTPPSSRPPNRSGMQPPPRPLFNAWKALCWRPLQAGPS